MPYDVPTSAPHGMATRTFRAFVFNNDLGEVLFTVKPATPPTGENGGEIRLRAPGQARGRVEVIVPDSAQVSTGIVMCDNDETRGNIRKKIRKRTRRPRTDREIDVGVDVINDGPGRARGTVFKTSIPRSEALIGSASVDGSPCTIQQTLTTPPRDIATCSVGGLDSGRMAAVDVVLHSRGPGDYHLRLTTGATNNGDLFPRTETVSHDVAQGSSGVLYTEAKSKDNGTGTVNISPAGNDGTPHPSCAAPGGADAKVVPQRLHDHHEGDADREPTAGHSVSGAAPAPGRPTTPRRAPSRSPPGDIKTASVRFKAP